MGALNCKRSCCCCYCCGCRRCCATSETPHTKTNSVGVLPCWNFKVLLLGALNSGKTEIGHALVRRKRLDYEPTNGVQYYRLPLPHILPTAATGQLDITEIGGNAEMQKIWPHYYSNAMAIIYCFDLSAAHEELWQSFEHLRRLLSHEFVRGKPLLLVATKTEDMDSGVQLYDIENAFQLEALARNCGSSIRLCCYERDTMSARERRQAAESGSSLHQGILWLAKYLAENWCILSIRIKCDESTKICKQQQQQQQHVLSNGITKQPQQYRTNRRGRRFGRFLKQASGRADASQRPRTAPPSISASISASMSSNPYRCQPAPRQPPSDSDDVPTTSSAIASSDAVPNTNSMRKLITDV